MLISREGLKVYHDILLQVVQYRERLQVSQYIIPGLGYSIIYITVIDILYNINSNTLLVILRLYQLDYLVLTRVYSRDLVIGLIDQFYIKVILVQDNKSILVEQHFILEGIARGQSFLSLAYKRLDYIVSFDNLVY